MLTDCIIIAYCIDTTGMTHLTIMNYIESKEYTEDFNQGATPALTGAQNLILRTLRHKIDKNVSVSEICL